MNADGSGLTRIVDLPYSACDGNFFDCEDIDAVDWSPDGQRIAFKSGEPTGIPKPWNLEVMNADGTGRTMVVDGDADETVNTAPSWSPDVDRISEVPPPRGGELSW